MSPSLRKPLACAVLCLAALAAVPASHAAKPSGDLWSRSVDGPISATRLGLPQGTPAVKLGRAAIERSARQLAGGGRLGQVRFAGEPLPPAPGTTGRRVHGLTYQQQVGGLRVLYSELDVAVAGNSVDSISGTVVPLKRSRLTGERRISARRARAIARAAVAGPAPAGVARPVAYAGEPAWPRPPRRAYVVEVAVDAHGGGDDSPAALCVVVDAATGKVLKRWRGFAARPAGKATGRRSARAAATKTVLIQMVDAKGTLADVTPNYRDLFTMGDPRKFGTDVPMGVDTFGTVSAPFLLANTYIAGVGRFFCVTRKYCGRDSGLDGSYNRHFYTANWGGSGAKYVHSQERIYIDVNSNTEPQTIAHEQGHSIDFHFRNDYVATREGDEVEEALGEMFAYDFERDQQIPGATGVRVSDVLASPGSFGVGDGPLPAHYDDYSCTAKDEHHNGYILAHAYWRLVKKIGHSTAGMILQGVPWQLPARREFGDVREALEDAAGFLMQVTPNGLVPVRGLVEAAFNEVGIQDASRRTDKCPGATP